MKLRHFSFVMITIFAGSLLLTGCPPKKKLEIEDQAVEEEIVEEQTSIIDNAEPTEFTLDDQDWAEIPMLAEIKFDYDQANLGAAQRATLKTNVAIIKKLPSTVKIRVAGHCDDRGTIEYNIALGQRRAQAVSSFYATAGVNKKRIQTISFGEERPSCREENESCWAKNRRAVTSLKNPEPVTIQYKDLK